jgi:hypothetical protein
MATMEIKKKNASHLNHVAAKDLELWEVSFPIDDHASKKSQTEPPLKPNKRLSSLWHGNPLDDDLHILVKAPGMLHFLVRTRLKNDPYSRSHAIALTQLLHYR